MLIDNLLWRRNLLFSPRQANFLPRLQILPRQLPWLPHI